MNSRRKQVEYLMLALINDDEMVKVADSFVEEGLAADRVDFFLESFAHVPEEEIDETSQKFIDLIYSLLEKEVPSGT